MHIVVIQVFVSLMLVGGGLLLLAHSVRQADYEHSDRLSLMPMEKDESTTPARSDQR